MAQEIKRINTEARYSQAVIDGGTIYLAGQIASNWDLDIVGQTKEIFDKIDTLLAACDSSKSGILSMTVWIKTFEDYKAFNEIYDGWIDPTNKPARATVRADMLDPNILIEIMITAKK